MITQLYVNTYQGLGDFLRTCMLNYCFFKNVGKDYEVNFKNSTLENCFKPKEIEKNAEILLTLVGNKQPLEILKYVELKREDIKEFRDHIYDQLQDYVKEEIEKVSQDIAIHCRTGDTNFLDKSMNPFQAQKNLNDVVRAITKIKNLEDNKNKSIRLFTDSVELRGLIRKTDPNIQVSEFKPTHTAFSKNQDNSNAVIEFFQMARSKKIYSFIALSNHLSSYSFLSSFLHDIPIDAVKFVMDSDGKTVIRSEIEKTYSEKVFQVLFD